MKRRAFTLVELMVAMAIIAVLLGMTVFGISAAQRVLRDNQRRKAVEDVALVLNEYLATFSEYPDDITFTSNTVTVATGYTVSLTGIAQAATTTDASQTAYCYELSTDGYKLGVVLESGEFYNQGTATELCVGTGDVHAVQ
jgi:prepilin-type N-terminal cleavage/methylation domain-containing protein